MRSKPIRQSQSESFEKRQRRRAVIGIVAGLISIVSWTFVFARVAAFPSVTVDKVDVYGASPKIILAIQMAAYKALYGEYLGMFPRSNSLIYPRFDIASAVASVSPLIDNVTVRLDGLNTLAISITEKTPNAMVCVDLPDLSDVASRSATDKCYLVDKSGLIFEKVGIVDTKDFQIFYMPDLPSSSAIGTYATSTAGFKAIQSFVSGIKSAGIEVISTLMKDGGEYEVYARNPNLTSIVVIHVTDASSLPLEQENLILFWDKMISESRNKKTHLEWDEIKLQFPPNVYYTEVKETK